MKKWNRAYHDRIKYHSLIDKVWQMDNLREAWAKVRSNKGAPGIDGISIYRFERDLEQNLNEVQRLLQQGRYKPKAVRRVYIPKPDGKERPLGIPTVRDRIVQQALKNILEPIFEPVFSEDSYGYRPNKDAKRAIRKVIEYRDEKPYVVDADIKKFFDNVDHDILLDLVNEKVSDGTVLRLLRQFLESGVLEESKIRETTIGTPQGGVISPLLANIYMNHLDRRLVSRGLSIVRYADDFLIFCETKREAHRAHGLARKILTEDLKLSLNQDKTKVVKMLKTKGISYLGFEITKSYIKPLEKSVKKFKDEIRNLTRRQQGKNAKQVISRLNPVIRGWGNYFSICTVKATFWRLDSWIQMRIRSYIKKRWWYTDIDRIPADEILSLGLITLEQVMAKPRPLLWRVRVRT